MVRSFVAALVLSFGIASAGHFIGRSITDFRNFDRYVEVKGLDEKIVKSDQAIWAINFSASGSDLKEIYASLSNSQNVLTRFLTAAGIKQDEIQKRSVSINDNQLNNYSNNKSLPRYTANSGIVVTTPQVDLVNRVMQKTGDLVQSGVLINSSSVRYFFTQLNDIKPEMLVRATENAREAAHIFAKNSQSSLGKIRKASQGVFTITSVNNTDGYDDNSSLLKKVRVVTSVDFFLN